jgi:hypothetical protein
MQAGSEAALPKKEHRRVETLEGTQTEKAQERRQTLQKDDENPDLEKLTPEQKFQWAAQKNAGPIRPLDRQVGTPQKPSSFRRQLLPLMPQISPGEPTLV